MSDLICITNRKLCSNNFSDQIEMIASAHPKAIVLREKDLSDMTPLEALNYLYVLQEKLKNEE